jgi:hypothetical protein
MDLIHSTPLIVRSLAQIGTFHIWGCRGFTEPSLSTTLNKSSTYLINLIYHTRTIRIRQAVFYRIILSIPPDGNFTWNGGVFPG